VFGTDENGSADLEEVGIFMDRYIPGVVAEAVMDHCEAVNADNRYSPRGIHALIAEVAVNSTIIAYPSQLFIPS
jgi:hypothetical protein